ncbi:Lrp/AsnC family transcriptional regulator [Inmirania thermothiophila]|uniref:AsnC family transcriptional regulator n=1 Tax=Inmirania thermothiophila TaxID=1750597 RepID=A0A3N1Y046_9GAMM|nr:Lrp/AsnC family transcriptional regulator [Inmirania thermothiophila]ROR32190.1 AsnC family transcriptional regulator [Inmirania thermothiophila]
MTPIDETDRRILRLLQANARITNAELAERVALSPSPCWRRVRRLEASGLIRAYVTLLDPHALGLDVSVFVRVRIESHREEVVQAFEAAVQARPEIVECYRMTGGTDYLLRVVTSDIAAYDRFLGEVLMHLPGVASMDSGFALRQVKYTTAMPL